MNGKKDAGKSSVAILSTSTRVLIILVLGLAAMGYFNGEHVTDMVNGVKTHV